MKIERRKNRTAEVYTASLNDIMFFLLLFFLIISTMVTPTAIKVLLPRASSAKDITMKRTIQLAITKDMHYFLDDREVAFEEIEPFLQQSMQTKKEGEEVNVVLQADKDLPLQSVVDVINIGNKLQIKMVLFTLKEG